MSESSRDQKVQAILHAYLQAVDAGQTPDREEIVCQHPEVAAELREFFADQEKMDRLAQSLHQGHALEGSITLGADDIAASSAVPQYVKYFGDYEVEGEIARGAMGVVFKARQISLNRPVALKMILKGELANEADVKRFRDEAEAAANLDHPNIVPIYEIGEHEGQQYFSMKLIGPGKRRAGLGVKETVRITALVARAVHHAHQRGILHRDLKPSNILFDENGDPHVADFGLAKRVGGDSGMTRSGAIVGTPSYMAPEQARAEKVLTTAVDVYSLGAILYEWLTGQPPFRGDDVLATLYMVANDEPIQPSTINPRIDRDLETICLKCLQKVPGHRYESATALAEDLDRWQNGEPTKARPLSILERTIRWLRVNAVAAAVIAIVGLTWGWSVGITAVITDLRGGEDRLQFWPTSPFHPMAWVRFIKQTPGAQAGMTIVALVLTMSVGWVIARAAKPKTPGSGFGFSVATGLIAGVVGFLFIAPISVSHPGSKLHPVDVRLMRDLPAAARDPTHQARSQLDYLRKWLPQEKQALDYPRWENDINMIFFWADSANRLDNAYSGVWFAALVSMGFFLGTSIASNWAIGLVEQRCGPGWNLRRYAEVYLPVVFALVSTGVFVIQLARLIFENDPHFRTRVLRDLTYNVTATGLAVGLATLAYGGVVRQWNWSRRAVVYFVWCVLFGSFVFAYFTR